MLYGRESERAMIGSLLEEARESRSGALVVRGEPGVGKTALLLDARERAADMHVLETRGVETESELPFAAVHRLVRPALGHLDALPGSQATALRGALGLAESVGQERFLVYAACLSLLSEHAEHRPVLCLVDDAHWLDAASAEAFLFVARRLDAEGIVMLFAAREGDVRGFEARDLASLTLEGLDIESAGKLLAHGVGVQAAPAVRDRLVERTGGNALALLELPSVLTGDQLAGETPLPEALPLTRQVETVFLERVRRLPDDTQRFLLVAAADDSESAALVVRAGESLGESRDALDAAEQAGLVAFQGGRLEFRHPLVRSAVYGAATSSERRAAHRALADALGSDDEHGDRRAWHLAASAFRHDDEAVRALDESARRAEERAGRTAAAKALRRAAELSADPVERGRRLVRAAGNLSLAGQDEEAVSVVGQAAALVEQPALRADLAHVQGIAAIRRGRPHEVVHTLVDAARHVASIDPAKAVELLMDATAAAWQGGDLAAYLEIARLAATIDLPPEDETSTMIARSLAGFAALIEGDPSVGVPLLQEVVAWGATTLEPRHAVWASFGAIWLGAEEGCGALLERAAALARERGEVGVLAEALGIRASLLTLAQQFEEASVAASEAARLARELRADNLELLPAAALALVAAVHGRDEEARRHAEDVIELAAANGLRLRASSAVYALALVDLGRARWLDALERLNSFLESASSSLDPMVGPAIPDKIEAAVRASRPEEAQAALPSLEAWAGYAGVASAQARLACSRALLAHGDHATEHFDEALRLSDDARPFDRARIRLLYGEHLRRARRRTDARIQLRAAIEAFERLRAEPWAERARTELRASGETARRRDPTTMTQLTPQELQIARLVAEGLSNKDVGAQLFLSHRTIDSHLRSVYGKLGITSRTQLARFVLGESDAVPASA